MQQLCMGQRHYMQVFNFLNCPLLTKVVAIICGYPENARAAAQTWLELIVAQLLHSYPALTVRSGLASLLDQCLSHMGATDSWQLSCAQQILEVKMTKTCKLPAL